MSLNIVTDNGEHVTLEFIESRAEAGLVFRVFAATSEPGALEGFAVGLNAALRSSPHHVFRVCCDSYPSAKHVEGCESASVKDKK